MSMRFIREKQVPDILKFDKESGKEYYSLDLIENIERCKIDYDYLGDVMVINEALIWHSVHKYIGKPEVITKTYCVEKDDILQLGRMGFIKAIKAFDTSRGVKFSSFSVTAIVREIKCFLRDSSSIIRPTRTANELINKIARLEKDLGYLPSHSDIAILLDDTEEKVTKAIKVGRTVKYLDEEVRSHANTEEHVVTLMDILPGSEETESEIVDRVYVDSIIDLVRMKLSEKELQVLKHRIEGLNQTQTAERENMSQMRVSRIMKKVAKFLEGHKLREDDNV